MKPGTHLSKETAAIVTARLEAGDDPREIARDTGCNQDTIYRRRRAMRGGDPYKQSPVTKPTPDPKPEPSEPNCIPSVRDKLMRGRA